MHWEFEGLGINIWFGISISIDPPCKIGFATYIVNVYVVTWFATNDKGYTLPPPRTALFA